MSDEMGGEGLSISPNDGDQWRQFPRFLWPRELKDAIDHSLIDILLLGNPSLAEGSVGMSQLLKKAHLDALRKIDRPVKATALDVLELWSDP